MKQAQSDHKTYWLDDPRNVDKLVWILSAVCALLLGADFFYHRHAHFDFENWFGFYAWYGFIMCVGLVLAAKMMRIVLKRPENYYDRY